MDLRLVSDDGEVLRLEAVGGLGRSVPMPVLRSFDEVLGPGGYSRHVLLGLREITFMDPGCMSWLLIVHKRFCGAGGRLVVHSVHRQVTELLEALHFERVLHIAKDEAAALKLLPGEQP